MNMLIICVLLVLYISIVTFAIVFAAITLTKELKLKRTLQEKMMLINIEVSKDTMDVVDSFIEDSLMQYRLKYLTEKDNIFITETKQKEMIKTVLKDVLENMSPSLYEKMSIVYNKNKLEDIIYMKVSMAVISFVATINGAYNE